MCKLQIHLFVMSLGNDASLIPSPRFVTIVLVLLQDVDFKMKNNDLKCDQNLF